MKKFWLGTVGVLALGMAAPASAADLAARPYTKAPPPPVVAPIYDWSGFYIGANGGWGSAHNCWDVTPFGGVLFNDGCVNRSPVVSSAESSATADRPASSFSAWKVRVTGRTSGDRTSAC